MKPDCTTCGVCCISPIDQESYCDVTIADEKRLGAKLVKQYVLCSSMFDTLCAAIGWRPMPQGSIKTVWTEEKQGPFKSYKFCRCACLQGVVMKKVKCAVYDKRPRACHIAMKPGDSACRRLRDCFQEAIDSIKKERNMYYVYMVETRNKRLYTGISTDPNRRVVEHNTTKKGAKCLRGQRPVRLMWTSVRMTKSEALKLEAKIKKLNHNDKVAFSTIGFPGRETCPVCT
jgi:putative endonuclease